MKKILILIALMLVSNISFAAGKIIYPTDATSKLDKTEFAYIAQEALRIEHNKKGKEYKEGKITKSAWDSYRDETFFVKQAKITQAILEQRELMKKSNRWTVNLDEL